MTNRISTQQIAADTGTEHVTDQATKQRKAGSSPPFLRPVVLLGFRNPIERHVTFVRFDPL